MVGSRPGPTARWTATPPKARPPPAADPGGVRGGGAGGIVRALPGLSGPPGLAGLAGVVDAVGAQAGVGVQEHGGLDLVGVAARRPLAQAPALDGLEQGGAGYL